jgi:aminopeptidase N
MKIRYFAFFIVILFSLGCNSAKKTIATIPVEVEERKLDTMVVTAEKPDEFVVVEENYSLPTYRPSYTLKNDLLHTKLDIRFDWEKQYVLGKATLTFKPYFYPTDVLTLDAKGFEIHNITFEGESKPLKYDYDGQILTIDLGKKIPKDQEYKIFIDYTAKPSEGPEGGSAAITSDLGLFFINHDGIDPNKPMQIWTQGETENNSRWFPTIDKPNERCTQEIYLTVDKKFKTLSNGLLISSTDNDDGTRTDYWKMNQPHAPYLFMLAVGDFAVVKDDWNGMLVDYYIEHDYEEYAKDIFAHTPEMLGFFSDKLGVKYPWDKFSQIIVRDFVSGAMENTTSVIFGEFIQKTERELIDNSNDGIVAHEMFHHWFGDFVTCESWSNLTLNEGFANYAEYLWAEHKYGKDEAENHRRSEMRGYIGSANQQGVHDLIHFSFDDKEDMFDAHSYNKGGLVLHMLRNYVGDKAFFAGLKKYLTTNAFTAVEAHDLRLAFEAVTGEDLNWFFNQWFFSSGHPIVEINYDYDVSVAKAIVTIEQTQDPEDYPAIFQLPFAIDVYVGKQKPVRYNVMMNERKQVFAFDASEKPALINVDAEKSLLILKNDNKTNEEFAFQYFNAKNFMDRFEALNALQGSTSASTKNVFKAALNDKHWSLRMKALSAVNPSEDSDLLNTIAGLAQNDSRSQVRARAFGLLGESGDKKYIPLLKKGIDNEKPYNAISAALKALNRLDSKEAQLYAQKLEEEDNGSILNSVGEIYAESGDPKKLGFFEKSWDKVDGFSVITFYENYITLVEQSDDMGIKNSLQKLKAVGVDMDKSPWQRFGATKAMNEMRKSYEEKASEEKDEQKKSELEENAASITQLIEEVKSKETNDRLKSIYSRF